MGIWQHLLTGGSPPDITVSGGDGWQVRCVWSAEQLTGDFPYDPHCWFSVDTSEFTYFIDHERKFVLACGVGGINGSCNAGYGTIRNRVRRAAEQIVRQHLPAARRYAEKCKQEAAKAEQLRSEQAAETQRWAESNERFTRALADDVAKVIAALNAGRHLEFKMPDRIMDLPSWQQKELRDAVDQIETVRRRIRQDQESARQAAELARLAERERRLSKPIPLAPSSDGIVFGTLIKDGIDFVVPVRQIRHTLLAGVSNAGKSVLLKSIIYQLIRSPETERLVLIDLKEGVSFFGFKDSPKCEMIDELPDAMRVIAELMPIMKQRLRSMRETGTELYRGKRIFVLIDEYTEIQSAIDRSDKRSPVREFADNLENLSRRARAAGIVIICALQRPTLDGISAAIRGNMDCRLVMRTATSQLAASMLEELDDLPVKPTQLPNGRYYYFDASRGVRRLLQAHVAPGTDLGDAS